MAARAMMSRHRTVAYLPSWKSAVRHFRAFCTYDEHMTVKPTIINSPSSQTVWPDATLGPLTRMDSRFPLPGICGPSHNLKSNENPIKILPNQLPDALTSDLQAERQFIAFEQYMNTVAEEHAAKEEEFLPDTPDPMDILECISHDCPALIRKDFMELFPGTEVSQGPFTVITVSQKTTNDMTGWSTEVEVERDELLDKFMEAAQDICQSLQKAGYWADFIDPTSGRPFLGSYTNYTMFETDDRYRHFGFSIEDLGCCKVISHHLWGTHSFVGCLFTNAEYDHPLLQAMTKRKEGTEQEMEVEKSDK